MLLTHVACLQQATTTTISSHQPLPTPHTKDTLLYSLWQPQQKQH